MLFSQAVTADEADYRDRLIVEQERLLDVYRCLLGVDLELVDGGCSEPSPFEPRNWEYSGDLGGQHWYTAHGFYRPAPPPGKSLANLQVSCETAPEFAYQVEFQLWDTLVRIEPGGTAEVAYRIGGASRTERWYASRGYGDDDTILIPSDVGGFLDDVLAHSSAPLRLSMAGEGGGTVSIEFIIEGAEWALARLPYHCAW